MIPPRKGLGCELLSAAALLAFCTAFFHPLLTGHTFTTVTGHYQGVYPWRAFGSPFQDSPQSDEADLTYPWRSFIGRELARGTVPFWNPHSFGGQPFFANGSSGVLYPPYLVAALLVPPDVGHSAVSVLHVFLSGLFMYLLMREWRVSTAGALVSSVAWMLSSFNMAWLHLEVVAPTAMWLPLSLFLVSRAVRRDEWPATVAAGAALACVLISGHLLFAGLVYGVAVVYAAGLTAGRQLGIGSGPDRQPRGPVPTSISMLRLATIAVGPFLIGGAVLLPTMIYLSGLGRVSVGYDAVHESIRVPYATFQYLLAPPPLPVTEQTMHEMVFAGVLTPFLAVLGVFRRGPGTLYARLMVAVIFLVATDTVLLKWAYTVFPAFSFFSPLGRLLNLFNFGVMALAGMGFDVLTKRVDRRGVVVAATCVVVAITGWQLITYARAVNPPFVPREAKWLYPKTPLIDALEAQGAVNGTAAGRLLPIRQSQRNGWTPPVLFAAESLVFGIDSLGGYDSTLSLRAENALRVLSGEDLEAVLAQTYRRAFRTSFEIDRVKFGLLPRLGVTTLVAPPNLSDDPSWNPDTYGPLRIEQTYTGRDGQLFQLPDSSGGPWLVSEIVVADTSEEAAELFISRGFDVTRSVILERRDLAETDRRGWTATPAVTGSVDVYEDGINTLRARVSASGSAWVVVPNVWERGWTARVNGRSVSVLPANYVFQAVRVPAGESHLELEYVPPGLWTGITASAASIGIAVVGLVLMQRRAAERFSRGTGHSPRLSDRDVIA
jgi:hypothetical protein